VPQDHERATLAPKIAKAEAEIDWGGLATVEYNRFRAFTPAPGAFMKTRFGRVRLSRCHLNTDLSGAAGTIVGPDSVALLDGALQLLEVQPEGKKRMSGRDFFNGLRLRQGMSLL
ncbi:MAG TPA: hypothetical protein VEX38_01785, partial [Fimbriimonadaceae bacterium]|nr:hypothetical protein [Fimbriimonadaceae bacterium]